MREVGDSHASRVCRTSVSKKQVCIKKLCVTEIVLK